MKFLRTPFLLTLFSFLFFCKKTTAQNWESPGSTPSHTIAYDQNGQSRTVVTFKNVYRSTDGGSTWQQKLSAANAPFLTAPFLNYPDGVPGKFQGFEHDRCRVFDEVLFLTANVGASFSSSDWTMYASDDGGTTLTEIFAEDEAFLGATYGYDHEVYQADASTYLIRFRSNGIAPSGDDASIYVSTDNGQSWGLLFRHPENNIHFAGATANDYVFLFEDQLIYRNKNTGALSSTLALPETALAASVTGSSIRLVSGSAGSGQLRGYESTNGGASFANFSVNTSAPGFAEAQILGDLVFASSSLFSFSSKSYRTAFGDWGNWAQVSAAPNYSDFYPYRLTSDGQLANLLQGPKGHNLNIFSLGDGQYWDTPFFVSSDNWDTFSPADEVPYSLAALPLLDGKHLRLPGDNAWSTTDGVDYEQTFSMTNSPFVIEYFQGAAKTQSYSDPSTTFYLTNDATTVASGDRLVVGAGNTLYAWRPLDAVPGIYKSTDQGDTWSFDNDGYFWKQGSNFGDDATGAIYSFETTGNALGPQITYRVSRSTDGGQSWQLLPGANIPATTGEDFYYNQFRPIVVYNNYFFVKSNETLYYSTDGGATFQVVNNLPFVVAGSQMYHLDGYLCFRTGAEQFYRVDINQWLGAGGGGSLPGANIDLSLTVGMTPPAPPQWSNFDVTYTVTNSGSITATGVGVHAFIASNADAIPQGGTSPTYGGGFTGQGGNELAPGETGTVTYHYFRKDGAMPQPWGQVTGYKEPDVDSRPGNADYPDVNEDDEAIFGGTPPDPCDPDVTAPVFSGCTLGNIIVSTTGNSATATWTEPTASDACPGSVAVTSTHQPGDSFPIGTTQVTYTATDAAGNQNSCSFTVTVTQQNDPCSPDVTAPVVSNCPSNISQTTTGNSANVTWTPPTATDACPGTPTLTASHQPGSSFNLGTTIVTYTATDAAGNQATCNFNVTVTQQGSGDIDLELSLVQPNANPSQWSSYTTTATVNNTGGETATGVKVSFAKPAGVVYTGGNEWTASQGSFNPFGNEVWTVGSIPAGGSATLTVSYFLLASTAPVAYSQVTAANETDGDSTPGNGTPPTPNEDDEASTGSAPPNPCLTMQHSTSNVQCDSNGTNSNPNDDTWTFSLTITLAGTNCTGTNWTIPGTASGTYGAAVQMGPFPISAGSKTFTAVEVGNASVTKTFTVSPPAPCSTGGGQPDLTIAGLGISNSPVGPGQVLNYDFDLSNIGTGAATGNFNVRAYISTDAQISGGDVQDGIVQTGNYAAGQTVSNIPGASTIPAGLAEGTYYLILKADADDQVTESNENNNTVSATFTVEEAGPGNDCDDISITSASGSITITGASSPHVLMKVFTPTWQIVFDCLDATCNDPQVVSGLGAGNHFVEIKLLDAGWGEICVKTQTVNVSSFGGPGSNALGIPELEGRPVQLLNVYPNPVYHGEAKLKIASRDERQETLEVYDAFGRLALSQRVDFRTGLNEVGLDVSDFRSGVYRVVIPGHDLRHQPRTIVVEKW